MTPGELAALYNVSTKTLKGWTDRHRAFIGERIGKFFSTLQVKKMYTCLGPPKDIFTDH